MHVVYQSGKYKQEADVEKNDIIVTFYTDEFDKRMIVLKSIEWVELIDAYENKMKLAREKWEAESQCGTNCPACDQCELKSC